MNDLLEVEVMAGIWRVIGCGCSWQFGLWDWDGRITNGSRDGLVVGGGLVWVDGQVSLQAL